MIASSLAYIYRPFVEHYTEAKGRDCRLIISWILSANVLKMIYYEHARMWSDCIYAKSLHVSANVFNSEI
jgi:hypothetical protein